MLKTGQFGGGSALKGHNLFDDVCIVEFRRTDLLAPSFLHENLIFESKCDFLSFYNDKRYYLLEKRICLPAGYIPSK